MLPCAMKFKDIVKEVEQNSNWKETEDAEGWTDELVPTKLRQETLINLKALAERFGEIKPAETELNKAMYERMINKKGES